MSEPDIDSPDVNSENQDDDIQVSKEFHENVIKFVKLDDLIRKKQAEIKELKNQRKPCESFVINYLDNIDETIIEITGGKLRRNKSETKSSLTKDIIRKAISESVPNPNIVEKILKRMDELRPLKMNVNLKRTTKRKKRSKQLKK